jgi:hypothetical protein
MTDGKLLKFLQEFGGPCKMDLICFHFNTTMPIALTVLKRLMASGYVERPLRGYYMACETEYYKPPKRKKPEPHVCPPGGFCTHCRAERLRNSKDRRHVTTLPAGHIVS